MHELLFADSARPVRAVVLHLALETYSIGHELILWQQRNPFIVSTPDFLDSLPAEQQRHWLVRGVDVCCQTWTENNFIPHTRLQKWKAKRTWKKWVRLTKNANYPLETAEFRNYLAAGRVLPPPPETEAGEIESERRGEPKGTVAGRELGAPLLVNVINFVSQHHAGGGCAFDFPYSLGCWLYFASMETEGRMRIENSDELKTKNEMAEHREFFRKTEEEKTKTADEVASEIPAGLATKPPDLE